MRTRTDLYDADQRCNTLLVLLPPALSSIDDFEEQGFIRAVRQRHLPVDLLLAEATGQQVLDKSMVSALASQVIQPALANGYRSIWLAGISIGAFSALYYAASHADQLAGVFLMAPYPGTADVLAEIGLAGDAAAWAQQHTSAQDERLWWQWLCQEARESRWRTPVYLATGQSDRFLKGQRLLAQLLPTECIHILPGNHGWPTWKALWENWLDHGPLALLTTAASKPPGEFGACRSPYNNSQHLAIKRG